MDAVDVSADQRARNEIFFREVNERVEEINDRLNSTSDEPLNDLRLRVRQHRLP